MLVSSGVDLLHYLINAIKIKYLVNTLIKTHPFKNDYVPEFFEKIISLL